MNHPALEELLDKLCSGDNAAAEKVFLEFEPYLRKVVRRLLPLHLRSKFDSTDIVQSAWSDVLQGFRSAGWQFTSVGHLKVFLVKATRNRFIDRYRQQHPIAQRQQVLSDTTLQRIPQTSEPEPGERMQADELWQRLLARCPPAHRPILDLKRQGVPLEEIVARTGLHPGSIRRILRNLASQIALDSETAGQTVKRAGDSL
jgi:RNA polymerase sigma-70 factor (ECF subfamily)